MKKIIKNEFQKFFKSRKNIIILILFLAYVFGINFYNLKQYNSYMKETAETYRSKYMQADGILSQNALRLEKDEDLTDEDKEELEKDIEFYNVERNKLMLIAQTYKEDKENKYNYALIAENDRYKNIIRGIENGVIEKGFLEEKVLDMEEIHKKMYINQYILDNDIQPILNPYTMTGANSLIMFLNGNNLLILIFFIALLSVDIYLSEVEEGSYKLAYSQPFERKEIFLGKVIVITIVSLAIIALGALLNFIIISTIYEIGDMNYPFVTRENIKDLFFGGNDIGYSILPLWKFVLMGFVLLLPILLLTIALIMCISIFLDSGTKTLGFSIMLLVLAFIFNNFISKKSIVNLIYPYCYLFIKNVIEVNTRSNYLFGILLNISITILLFIMSYRKFIYKDFLGARE